MAAAPEKRIEAALVSAISALNYMTTNSISVRTSIDFATDKVGRYVSVSVPAAERIAPNYNYYKSDCEVGVLSHLPNDESGALGDALYNVVNSYVQSLAVSTLNAAVTDADITIDGIVPTSNDNEKEENVYMYASRFDLFYTYTAVAPT